MSQDEGESLEEAYDHQIGVILGCWDHEKTAVLIQDLEQSVSLVERKCKNLFDELKYYKKKYVKKSDAPRLTVSKEKTGKLKKPYSFSETEMDITLRKNLNNIRAQTLFEKQFETKLCSINKELREAALKMGLKDNIILRPKDYYEDVLDGEAEDEPENFWCEMQDKLKKQILFNDKSKSDPVISGHAEEAEYSKITKNELELYQKLSKLRMKGERNLNKLNFVKKRQKMRFCCKKKTLGNCKDFLTSKAKPKKPKSRKNKFKRKGLGGTRSVQDSVCSKKKTDELETEKISKFISEDLGREKRGRTVKDSESQGSETLGEVIRKTVPFTTCASTSKSYNIGVNMQQLLFLSKYGKKPKVQKVALEKTEARFFKKQTFESDEAAKSVKINDVEKGRAKPPDSKIGHTGNDEVNNLKEKENGWEEGRSQMPNFRKVRYRYTGNSPDGFMEFLKSTTSQYTNGRRSMIKSETKAAYSIGSKIMVSDCRRTQVFQLGEDDACFENASGDGTCTEGSLKLNSEWMKFLNMCRMFTSLKEKLPGNCLTPADVELKSLESEIDFSIEKYRAFLQFYNKFLHLNHCLKSLKTACESKSYGHVASISKSLHGKSFNFKYTSTKNMKKVLREVQALQDKIRLVKV